jgi:hypothetical protein
MPNTLDLNGADGQSEYLRNDSESHHARTVPAAAQNIHVVLPSGKRSAAMASVKTVHPQLRVAFGERLLQKAAQGRVAIGGVPIGVAEVAQWIQLWRQDLMNSLVKQNELTRRRGATRRDDDGSPRGRPTFFGKHAAAARLIFAPAYVGR